MNAIVVTTPFGSVGIDCLQPLSLPMIVELSQLMLPGTRTGLTYVMRYLENLTAAEAENILSNNLGLMFVGESRPNGYVPTSADGASDGAREVAKAKALATALGTQIGNITLTCDLEGMGGGADDTIAYANAWADAAQNGSCGAMAYVGAGVPLTPAQLYGLHDTLYFHSLSNVQQVTEADYAMLQAYPTQTLDLGGAGKLQADVSFVYRDKRGRAPTLLRAA